MNARLANAIVWIIGAVAVSVVVAGIWGNVTDPRPLARVTRHVPVVCTTHPLPASQHIRGVAYIVLPQGC